MTAETKAQKFDRLSAARLETTLKQISLIGNLAARSAYDYQPPVAFALIDQMQAALDDVSASFGVLTRHLGKPDTPKPAIEAVLTCNLRAALIAAPRRAAPQIIAQGSGALERSYAAWALDCLIAGKHSEARAHLRRALGGKL